MKRQKWIGVDLDGTLAIHNPGDSVDHIGQPIQLMVDRVRLWLKQGLHVKIMTARVCRMASPEDVLQQRKLIDAFCITQFGQTLEITHEKDFAMEELWDDRAFGVIRNTGVLR